MIMDAKWAIVTPSTLVETLVAGTTVAFLSDYIDMKSAGYTDGGGELNVHIRSVVSTAATGASYLFELLGCSTYNGTYVAVGTKTVARADCATGKFVGMMPIPKDMPQFMKLQITGAASMTGSTTFAANVVTE